MTFHAADALPAPSPDQPTREALFKSSLALCAGLIVLTRLPQLVRADLVPDGDEAVVGLMAKHIAEGRGFPIFFYGQSYGLSCLEAGAAALAFRLFGLSPLTLKAHTTAFVFAHVSLWLVALGLHDARLRTLRLWGLGACLGVIYYAQPVWLAVVAPFLPLIARPRSVARDLLAAGGGAATVIALVLLASSGLRSAYWSWTSRTGTARILAGGLLVAFGVVGIGASTEFGSVSFSGEPGAYRGTEQGARAGAPTALVGYRSELGQLPEDSR